MLQDTICGCEDLRAINYVQEKSCNHCTISLPIIYIVCLFGGQWCLGITLVSATLRVIFDFDSNQVHSCSCKQCKSLSQLLEPPDFLYSIMFNYFCLFYPSRLFKIAHKFFFYLIWYLFIWVTFYRRAKPQISLKQAIIFAMDTLEN